MDCKELVNELGSKVTQCIIMSGIFPIGQILMVCVGWGDDLIIGI